MASNYNRKSVSSGSRRPSGRVGGTAGGGSGSRRTSGHTSRPSSSYRAGSSRSGSYRAVPGGRFPKENPSARQNSPRLSSVRVGDVGREERRERARRTYRSYLVRIVVALSLVGVVAIGGAVAYNSSLFTIDSVSVTGVEHLTKEEMSALADVPAGTTLLRVDAAGIKNRLMKNAWVADVSVNRVFPDTLELAVTERTIEAVVSLVSDADQSTQQWAIASDGMWLMPIPDQDSEQGRRTSPQIYVDAQNALHIDDVPYGTKPEIGTYCTDSNINNALAIVSGLTTDLADRVRAVAATDAESTTLTLEDNTEIVFGTADDIRDKERVCQEIEDQYPDVYYINVRTVDRPTWKSL